MDGTARMRDCSGRFHGEGGELFLDDAGEIPLELQSKLLRVLQEGQFVRIGDEATRRVNVRVVPATNRNLRQEVDEAGFVWISTTAWECFRWKCLPCETGGTTSPTLTVHFLCQATFCFHIAPPTVPAREMERAQQYDWPGNVRELRNLIERAAAGELPYFRKRGAAELLGINAGTLASRLKLLVSTSETTSREFKCHVGRRR